ncbi:MAG: hypothetical protein RBS57_07375 [Desulforhabdus sp.]|jgi:hypothetical protein|nr:hypothetical protein [Desulforhabdus sp.]
MKAANSEKIEKLLMTDWGDKWGQPLTVEELLKVGKEAFEPLFEEPPIGPIPDYLTPHLHVYGCVAEYEDKLEELDRWKARELDLWLKDKVGRKWAAGQQVYVLRFEERKNSIPAKYWFELVKHGDPEII